MAITYFDGMSIDSVEDGNGTNERWTVLDASTIAEAAGLYSRYALTLSVDAQIRCRSAISGGYFCSFYVKFASWGSGNEVFLIYERSDGTDLGWLVVGSDGSLLMGMNSDSGDHDTGFDFELDTWYIVSFEAAHQDNDTPLVVVRSADGSILESHEYAGDGAYLSAPSNFVFHTDDGLEYTIDNWVIDSSADPYATFGAPYVVIGLWANGAGDTNEFDSGTYADVDERPCDHLTTYIEDNDVNSIFLCHIEDTTDAGFGLDQVFGVLINRWCQSPGGDDYYPIIKTNSSIDTGALVNLPTLNANSWHSSLYLLNPITASAWTEGEVNSLQIGMKNASANTVRGSCFYAEVLALTGTARQWDHMQMVPFRQTQHSYIRKHQRIAGV